ncbi:SDR family NAD(P)-dependent oxidoreductase [Lacrimispora sp.]|uniref:SDR family NAD(P)-dependent oxidoreductase n=1 Tax=Lacrimispora sp. TaxID=2719234 RepID=UPI0028AAA2ED|nr:SDR family NAD(P)-dependent oxidoreductase [Lacrimispora sp.]
MASMDKLLYENEFSGKRVLVTGGTKGGIGEAIVKRLTHAGAIVITTARKTPDEMKTSDLFIQADISTPDGTTKIVTEVLQLQPEAYWRKAIWIGS